MEKLLIVIFVLLVAYALDYALVALLQWAAWHCGDRSFSAMPTWALTLMFMVAHILLKQLFCNKEAR